MAVNDRYPLEDVVAECRRYVELRGRKVFVEYVMLAGVNDTAGQARALAALLGPKAFKVNLIPYNPTGRFEGSSRGQSPPSLRRSCATAFRPPQFGSPAVGTSRPPAASSPPPAEAAGADRGQLLLRIARIRHGPCNTGAPILVSVDSGWWPGGGGQ